MSSPDCKRQKLADGVAKMSNVSPTKDNETQTDNVPVAVSASNKQLQLRVINQSFQKFQEVAKMRGFVDRTMLIEELLQPMELLEQDQDSTYAMMFAPSKFGKSVNLDMISLFCDIEDKHTKTKEDVTKDPTMQELRSNPSENMKVFLRQFGNTQYEECLILKREEFVIQHFGRHPVVFFNFKDITAENKSGAISYCAEQVQIGYRENKYLIKSKEFQSDDVEHVALKQICTDWVSYSPVQLKGLSEGEVIFGLKNLIKMLRFHWGRLPVFLVDEIDKPCVVALQLDGISKYQIHEIGTVITNVICSILKTEDEQLKLQAALLTGICKLRNAGLSPVDNTVPVYFLSDDRFSKYYGMTAQEVESLVKKFYGPQGEAEVEKIINDINATYNGYYQRSTSGKDQTYARYCLFSVLNYIEEMNKDKKKINLPFWSDGGFLVQNLVTIIKKCHDIKSPIQEMLYGDSATVQVKYDNAVDVPHILGIYRDEIDPDKDAVLIFFLQRGYLAHNLEKPEEKDIKGRLQVYVRIPNREIKAVFEDMFMAYHNQLPNEIKSQFTSCGAFFKSIPTQNSTEFQKNLNKLCEHFKCIFEYMQWRNEASICSCILAILKRDAEYEKGEVNYAVQYFDNGNTPCRVYIDVWGRHGNFALIIEVKYNSGASGEPGKSGDKTRSSLAAAEDIVKLLPGKINPEAKSSKAGTGRDLQVLKSPIIEHYVLIGLAVDGDYTTHMLVFRDETDWENVIQVNPENHVKELISTHLKSK